MGGDFEHRWTQTREAIMALKELWTKDEAEFHGHYYDFPPSILLPKTGSKAPPPGHSWRPRPERAATGRSVG